MNTLKQPDLIPSSRKTELQKVLARFAKERQRYYKGDERKRPIEILLSQNVVPNLEEKMDWDKDHLDRFVRLSRLSASEVAVVALSYHNQYTPDENEPFYPHCGILYLMEEVISEWLSSHFDSLSAEEVWFVIGAYAKSNQFHDDFMVRFNQTAENS